MSVKIESVSVLVRMPRVYYIYGSTCVNLRGLYPIAEVPVPRDGDKKEKADDKGRTIMKMTNLSRFCRSYPIRARACQICPKKTLIFIILTRVHANVSRGRIEVKIYTWQFYQRVSFGENNDRFR